MAHQIDQSACIELTDHRDSEKELIPVLLRDWVQDASSQNQPSCVALSRTTLDESREAIESIAFRMQRDVVYFEKSSKCHYWYTYEEHPEEPKNVSFAETKETISTQFQNIKPTSITKARQFNKLLSGVCGIVKQIKDKDCKNASDARNEIKNIIPMIEQLNTILGHASNGHDGINHHTAVCFNETVMSSLESLGSFGLMQYLKHLKTDKEKVLEGFVTPMMIAGGVAYPARVHIENYDTMSANYLIDGMKLWVLFPPEQYSIFLKLIAKDVPRVCLFLFFFFFF